LRLFDLNKSKQNSSPFSSHPSETDNISMLVEEGSSSLYPQSSISVVAVTWNLYASLPPINSLLQLARSLSFSPIPDLIVFGTQECQRSLFFSFCCEGKQEWEAMLT
jgi:hypothetical protein